MSIQNVSFLCFIVIANACVPSNQFNRAYVAQRIESQTTYRPGNTKVPGEFDFPPNVNLSDGINEDEAIALALYNNAQFQADLAMISIANADLIDAGTVSNPLLRYLSPNAGIMASGYINFAFDFIWQRPKRIAAATAEAERIAENMVYRGYSLIQDVQLAYADILLTKEKAKVYYENLLVRSQMRMLTLARLRSGDISELEANTFLVDSLNANDLLLRSLQDTLIYATRLNTLLGFRPDTLLTLDSSRATGHQKLSENELLEMAYANQPELRAARIAIESAGQRIGWEKSRIINFTAVLNYQHLNGDGNKWIPNAFNPGFQLEVPVFNRNQGRIARAKAELQQASFQYVALRHRIARDVSEAYHRYELSYASFQLWNNNVLPSLDRAVRLAQKAYQLGETSYLPVLETMRQWLDARLRKAEIEAELKRSVSSLNFTIGKKFLTQ